jgi:protein dithiol:quinone oxidoreductase
MMPGTRAILVASVVISLGLFCGGIALGALLHLAACPLCIIQRMLYLLFGVVTLIGLAFHRPSVGCVVARVLMVAVGGTGTFVAGYQTWIQHFPPGIGCAANSPWWENFVYWAGEKIPLFFQAGGVCEDSSWKFLGLTIAEYSLLAFSSLTVLALIVLLRRSRS